MELPRVILPAKDRYLVFDPARRRSILAHRWMNVSLVTLLVKVGMPRYMPRPAVDSIPNEVQISACVEDDTFLEK